MAGLQSPQVCDNGSRIIFPPQSVAASDGQFDLFVRITWSDQSQIESGYRIKRNGTLLRTLPANSTQFRDSTAVAGTTYSYQVIAFDAGNNESQAVADNGFRGFILPPLNVSATDGQYPDRVRITWTDQATNETGYKIYRNGSLIATVAANATAYEDVITGPSFTYCVTTKGTGAVESIQVCDTGGTNLPAPANVSASDNTFDDRVEITWSDPGLLEDGFEISRNGVVLATTKANVTSYSDFTAVAGTTYNYCVKAVSNQGGASALVCDNGVRSPVLAPTQVQATDGTFENRVDITWQSASTTAVLFKIYRNTALIKTVPNTTRFYSDYGGVAGVTYDYKVSAVTAQEIESAQVVDVGYRTLRPPTGVAADDDVAENRVLVSWTDNSAFEHGYY
jgi:fibronectin type 3 domain-containing protein